MIRTKARACTGKKRHKVPRDAEAHRDALLAKGGVRLATYRCRSCDGWHVGHLPKPRTTR